MSMNSLKDLYIDQLQDLHSANRQSLKVAEELHERASNGDLSDALSRAVSGIRDGIDKVERIIREHDADPTQEHCKGMEGLVKEARAHAIEASIDSDEVRDAMIITQYQRMVHYAIAGYGCLAAFAKRLDLDDDASTIDQCLDECYEGDRAMTKLAESEINYAAV